MNRPLVSVIMPVYNSPKEYLFQSVGSILNQTYKDFELLIIDDCSSISFFDDPLFNDKRIKIIKNSTNRGCSYCCNIGVKLSSGKYIARMDSDDISLPTRLEKQVSFMEKNSDVVVCGTWFEFFGAKNHTVKNEIDDNEYYRCCLLFSNFPTLLHPSVMIRKKILDANDINYDLNFRFSEDYKMWVRLSRLGIITNIKEVLVKYRVHANQLTYQNFNHIKTKSFDDIVRLNQLMLIGVDLDENEQKVFLSTPSNKKIYPKAYKKVFNKILLANKKSGFFNQIKLTKRIDEQWEQKILNTNNIFVLFWSIFTIKHEFKHIILIKYYQFKRKILQYNNITK